MALSVTAFDQYLQAIAELQARVVQDQRAILIQVAKRMAEATRRDRRIFLFGTGHSHLLAEEGFYRAGGLASDTVRVYLLRLEDLIALAKSRVTRSLTIEECQQFLHTATCPSAP